MPHRRSVRSLPAGAARVAASVLVVGLGQCLAGDDPPRPPADKARVESEARGQAAEADRLLKAGDFAAALPLYEAERKSRALLGDVRYEAYAARAVGCCRAGLGDDDAAVSAWLDAVKLDARRDDPGFEGYDWLLIGTARTRQGRTADAIVALNRALPRLGQGQDADHEADARLILARCHLLDGQAAQAGPHAARARELADRLKDPTRRAASIHLDGLIASGTGDPARAAQRLAEAATEYARLAREASARGDRAAADLRSADEAAARRSLGEALVDLRRFDAAAAAFRQAAAGHDAVGDAASAASDWEILAATLADSDDLAGAIASALKAVDARRAALDVSGEVDALVDLANYRKQANDLPAAMSALSDALKTARPTLPPSRVVRLLVLASAVDPDRASAAKWLDEAEALARTADNAALSRIASDARKALGGRPAAP